MNHYYFNDTVDNNGNHEVHTKDCAWLPNESNRTYIGYCNDCEDAISKAKSEHPYKSFDGCYWCCRNCHNG